VARAALDGGDFPQALALLSGLERGDPDAPELGEVLYQAHLGFGRKLLEEGRLDHSYGEFGEALKLKPDDPAALDGQKQVVLVKNWNKMEAEWGRNPEAAIAALEEIVHLDPNFREARQKLYALLVSKADRLIRTGTPKEALPALTRALEVNPGGGEARQRLATLPVPGATYTGRTGTGAPVSITVNDAGTAVRTWNFGIENGNARIADSPCGWWLSWNSLPAGAVPITNGSFSDTGESTIDGEPRRRVLKGTFSEGQVTGTIAVLVPNNPRCNTAEVSWSATAR
jgi:tetratricopeptide (TPR) repeat protein